MRVFKKSGTKYWVYNAWIGPDGLPCEEGAPGARFREKRRVPKGTPGAERVEEESSKWYGRLPGSEKAIPLSKNKRVAQEMLAALLLKQDRARVGLNDP